MTLREYFSLMLAGMSSYMCGPMEQPNGTLKTTSCPCGQSNKRVRIVGGEETAPNQYPFMLLLVMTKDLQHFCGASILTQRHAITAAHCTYPLKPNTSISVVAGAHDKRKINQRSVVVPVQKYLIHESYSPTLVMDDISLLFLQKPLRFGPNVSPICIPTKKMCLENKDVLMIGWGMTGGDKPASNVLRRIDVKILPYHVCKYNYFFMYNPFPWKVSQICTRAKGKGGCRGDSGGPVIYLDPEVRSYVLAGLVSFGEATCSTDYPTVETDVSYYVSWITSRIKEGYCHKV